MYGILKKYLLGKTNGCWEVCKKGWEYQKKTIKSAVLAGNISRKGEFLLNLGNNMVILTIETNKMNKKAV